MNKYEQLIQVILPKLIERYNNGLAEDSISSALNQCFNNRFDNTEILDLFKWRNGINVDYSKSGEWHYIIPGYFMQTLEAAIQSVEMDTVYEFKSNGLLPIFSSVGGEHICWNIKEPSTPLILASLYDPTIEKLTPIFVNHQIFIECIKEAVEDHIIYPEGENLAYNLDNWWSLCKIKNPMSPFWR